MNWPKSAYTKHLEAEIERLRNDNRILLSALLERAVSREAALMLRKPEELSLSLQSMKDRAKVHYEAVREMQPKTSSEAAPDLRHWRGARGELETASAKEVAGLNSNDSVERIEAKVKVAQGA
jgi:hypothetical protein